MFRLFVTRTRPLAHRSVVWTASRNLLVPASGGAQLPVRRGVNSLRPTGFQQRNLASAAGKAAGRAGAVVVGSTAVGMGALDMLKQKVDEYNDYLGGFGDAISAGLGRLQQMVPDRKETSSGSPVPPEVPSPSTPVHAHSSLADDSNDNDKPAKEKTYSEQEMHDIVERIERDSVTLQQELQKEIDRLKDELENLRVAYLTIKARMKGKNTDGVQYRYAPTLVELYSDVLETLEQVKGDFKAHDNLPRIVVVGDQSAGKTSVLENILGCRILPRGAGEMATRTPVQVTLSEGPYRTAQFREQGNDRIYDLRDVSDIRSLRLEIDRRMKDAVEKLSRTGERQTVSASSINLSLRGPGLPRMVLVDLPGVIGHATHGMAKSTKEDITSMCLDYIRNPYSIIVCIVDGSVDAERSNIADLVTEADPDGKRTIAVVTKIDVAEMNGISEQRLEKLVTGKLFNMNALMYFAVIAGSGRSDDSIDDIKEYENSFFRNSRLVSSGTLKSHQIGTANMSRAVSKEFWRKVRASVEDQLKSIHEDLRAKEVEWNSKYKGRMITGSDAFHVARHEIMTNSALFSEITSGTWEEIFAKKLWSKVGPSFTEGTYVDALTTPGDAAEAKAALDVRVSDLLRNKLPEMSAVIGYEGFLETFQKQMRHRVLEDRNINTEEWAKMVEPLTDLLLQRCGQGRPWTSNEFTNRLSVIQSHALEDAHIEDQRSWQEACLVMESEMRKLLNDVVDAKDYALFGPRYWERWYSWKSKSLENNRHLLIKNELLNMMGAETSKTFVLRLGDEEKKVLRGRLESGGLFDATDKEIEDVHRHLVVKRFATLGITTATECRAHYGKSNPKVSNGMGCHEVQTFWQLHNVVKLSAKSLRQQAIARKGALEQEVRDFINQMGQDQDKIREIMRNPRIDLAEQIELRRILIRQLESFIEALEK
eukprot:Clim_evm32s148 gene=Clim_evmTU32s148